MATKSRAAQSGPAWGPREAHLYLNADVPRVDGPVKVTGAALYTHDRRVPGMLYGRILCCPYPVARPQIDIAPAMDVDGVRTALSIDESLLDGWTQWLGQPIAAVAAETPELAEDGLRAIRVEYELGEWAVDHAGATAADAPQITSSGNRRFVTTTGEQEAARAALEAADVVVEGTYTLPVQHHVSLETHGVLVDYRGGDEATIYASTQGTFTVAGEAADILEVPQNRITVIVEHMGGGFGAKFGLDLCGLVACRLAKDSGSPVQLMFTRSDEFHATGNRSGTHQVVQAGASEDGRILSMVATIDKLGGLGRGSHPGLPYIYDCEVAFTEIASVLTNTDASRTMRAPGHPQASFAMESVVDELAAELGWDPLEFRLRNLSSEVYHRQLARVADEIGWADHDGRYGPPSAKDLPERAIGIGFAIATWGTGGRPACQVDVRIEKDGSVTSTVGAQDLGTGTRTYVATIVADELRLPLELVTPRIGNSNYGQCVASGGSVTVPSLAPAVKDAAYRARLKLFEHVAPLLGTDAVNLYMADGGEIVDVGDDAKRISWKEACASLGVEGLAAHGEFQSQLAGRVVHGAQAAKVEVETLTGEVRVKKMVCIQDVGLPLNRLAVRSQLNGGMIQAMSYGLWEERILDADLGLQLNPGLEEYKIAGSTDIPEIVSIIDDDDTREQVMGVGEPPAIPGQSAVANAIYNACGVRIRSLPLSRDKVVQALAELS